MTSSPLGLVWRLAQHLGRLGIFDNCRDCHECCCGPVPYVLPSELAVFDDRLKRQLYMIKGVAFLKKDRGKCCFLGESGECAVYIVRPLSCRLYPFDVFSRNGQLEWVLFVQCPLARKLLGNLGQTQYAISLLSALEKLISPQLLREFEKEDTVSSWLETPPVLPSQYLVLKRIGNQRGPNNRVQATRYPCARPGALGQ